MKAFSIIKIVAAFAILLAVSGCAVNRSVVAINVPDNIANPANGVDVKIVAVTDDRIFEFQPATPDIPSLSEDEVNNADIKARAFARKRNAYGKALGDVVLPEGQTVADVMQKSLSNAFRAAGYRVLKPGDPAYEKAIPINAHVVQFWSWIEWGFWELPLHNKAEVMIKAPIGAMTEGLTVQNESVEKHSAVFESDWQSGATKGLEELSAKVTEELKKNQ